MRLILAGLAGHEHGACAAPHLMLQALLNDLLEGRQDPHLSTRLFAVETVG